MRRTLILTAFLVLVVAPAAQAYFSYGSGGILGTFIPLTSTRCEVDLRLLSSVVPVGKSVIGLDVACVTVQPSATFYLGGTAGSSGTWSSHLMSNLFQLVPGATPANPRESYFNFNTQVDAIVNAGAFPNVKQFTGATFASASSGYLSANGVLGSLIVDNGTKVQLSGTLMYNDGSTAAFNSLLIPEPGALAMLIATGFALAVWRLARRRRR